MQRGAHRSSSAGVGVVTLSWLSLTASVLLAWPVMCTWRRGGGTVSASCAERQGGRGGLRTTEPSGGAFFGVSAVTASRPASAQSPPDRTVSRSLLTIQPMAVAKLTTENHTPLPDMPVLRRLVRRRPGGGGGGETGELGELAGAAALAGEAPSASASASSAHGSSARRSGARRMAGCAAARRGREGSGAPGCSSSDRTP